MRKNYKHFLKIACTCFCQNDEQFVDRITQEVKNYLHSGDIKTRRKQLARFLIACRLLLATIYGPIGWQKLILGYKIEVVKKKL